MKTAELEGVMLDYWVARADEMDHESASFVVPAHAYSTEWAFGGPIIERERIGIYEGANWPAPGQPPANWIWYACVEGSPNYGTSLESVVPNARQLSGPTPLVAAMRAYVASRFGDEVPA